MRILTFEEKVEIRRLAKEVLGDTAEVMTCSNLPAAKELIKDLDLDAVIVDLQGVSPTKEFCAQVESEEAAVILVGTPDDVLQVEGWPRSAYLTLPLDPEKVKSEVEKIVYLRSFKVRPKAIGKRLAKRKLAEGLTSKNKVTVAVWRRKGGVGATTISCYLAHYLRDYNPLILDLNFQSSSTDMSYLLGLSESEFPNLLTFARAKDKKKGFSNSLRVPKASNFSVIPPPVTSNGMGLIHITHIDELMDIAKSLFEIIIIDLPNDMGPLTAEAIGFSTHVLYVSDFNYATFLRMTEVVPQVEAISPKTRQMVVLNQFKKKQFSLESIENILSIPIIAVVPEIAELCGAQEREQLHSLEDSVLGRSIAQISTKTTGIKMPEKRRLFFGLGKKRQGGKKWF